MPFVSPSLVHVPPHIRLSLPCMTSRSPVSPAVTHLQIPAGHHTPAFQGGAPSGRKLVAGGVG